MPVAAARFRVDPGAVLRAVEWLKHARIFSVEGALEYLEQLRSCGSILECYRQMFPALWASSTAPTSGWDEKYPGHTPREGEFLKVISRRYFELPDDMGWEADEQHYDTIPVSPMQGDSWCCADYTFEELRACYYIPLSLFGGSSYWEECANRYHLDEEGQRPAAEIDFQKFRELCLAERTPLKYLPLALDLMHYETGNIWLDLSFCAPQPVIAWTTPNILNLSRLHKEARRAMRRMDELDRYLDQHPTEGVPRAIELWNLSAKIKGKRDVSSSNS
ncbi:MAG: hypothetical protein ACJ74Q_15045 [Pyrinomonadaceae bacterium]